MWIPALLSLLVLAQDPAPEVLKIPRIDRAPTMQDFEDMMPSTDLAKRMAKASGFKQRSPRDGEAATQPTEVYAGYDKANLYLVFLCFDNEPEKVRARMFPRGVSYSDDDWVHVVLDTFHD